MPDTDNYAAAPIPLEGESNFAPQWMSEYHAVVDPKLNLRAESEADRNTRYADAPLGVEVTKTDGTVKWIKRSGGWSELWRQTTTDTVTPEWWSGGGYSWAGSMLVVTSTQALEVRISCVYTGPNVEGGASNGGNIIPDLRVCRIPFSMRRSNVTPMGRGIIGGGSHHDWHIDTDGWLFVDRTVPGYTVVDGNAFGFHWVQVR